MKQKATVAKVAEDLEYLTRRFEAHMTDENIVEKATLNRIEDNLKINTEKTNEMYDAFMPAKAGFMVIASMGKAAKPVFWILALAAAVVAYFKTGNFQWPPV